MAIISQLHCIFAAMKSFDTIIGTDVLQAIAYLQNGETVAIPTETVYGLAANALDDDAVLKIFEAKNRPHFDPLIVHVANKEQIPDYVSAIPEQAIKLMNAFMPGPITLLLKKKANIPDLVTSGLDTVAIRVPQHPLALALLNKLDFPLAAPSANPFGYISPTTAQHVYDQLHGKIPYILDGGSTNVGVESTIVGFEDEQVMVYRLGGLALDEIEKIVGPVLLNNMESSNPMAPGLLKSHYAPRKKLYFNPVVKTEFENIAVIAFDKFVDDYPKEKQVLLSEKGDLHEAARNLFSVMRQLDKSDAEIIVAVKFPDHGLGLAINDRLKRASAE